MKHHRYINVPLLKLGFCLTLLLYAFWLVSQVSYAADTTIFADDFNSPLGTNWQVTRNSQLAQPEQPCMYHSSPTNWVQSLGSLTLAVDGPPCFLDFVPSNLDLRGVHQYQLRFTLKAHESTAMDRSMTFLWQGDHNWYNLKLFGNNISIEKVVNGTAYSLPNSVRHFPFQVNRVHDIQITVTAQQNIKVFVDQQLVLDVNDQPPFMTPLQRQAISLRGGVGVVSRSITTIDDVSIEANLPESTDVALDVPLLMQTDPRWKDLEYDHAHLWSDNPTMSRWGCAVTSMAMILNHYQIIQLPNGQPLTPQTLNAWLTQQPDGYIQGGVNWLAVSRLTQLMSQQLGTPKLEFSRASGTPEQIVHFATQELRAQKPVILGYPGHFFVADGTDSQQHTLLIKDPYFPYQRLAQSHAAANNLNTVRRFQPSQTDLSYLYFTYPAGATLEVTDQFGNIVDASTAEEFILDPVSQTESPRVHSLVIAKPSSGQYAVKLTQNEQLPYQIDVYHYDTTGNVQKEVQTGVAGPTGVTFELQYQKQPSVSSTVSPQPTAQPTPTPLPTASPHPAGYSRFHWLRNYRQHQIINQMQRLMRLLRSYQQLFEPSQFFTVHRQLERLSRQVIK